ncbi:hypothetical protein [Streptomyces sp. NPDC058084]|uniref:hypothetical protein n=1 Tax=Streptomyces sp. NPDC058084 TaxID=3346333 RepID=UPI0036E0F2C7
MHPQGNNDDPHPPSQAVDTPDKGRFRHLRKWLRTHGQSVQAGFWQGAGYKLGSGAVSILILWAQSR